MRRWWLELELVAELLEIILVEGVVYYIFPWVSVCCAVPILGFLEPLVEARCSTTGPKVSSPAIRLKTAYREYVSEPR